jgi:tetratricopeptide (TPR) repeat protein
LKVFDLELKTDTDERHRIEEERDGVVKQLASRAGRSDLRARWERLQGWQKDIPVYEINLTEASWEANRAAIRRAARAALAEFQLGAEDSPANATRCLEAFRPCAEPGQLEAIAADCYEVLLAWAEAEAPPGAKDKAGARLALHLLDLAAALGEAHRLSAPLALHLRRARYLALAGKEAEARAERHLADGQKPETALDLFLTAKESYLQGETAKAAADCDAVLLRQPDHFWALYLEALCHTKAKHWGEAKAEATACLSRRPTFAWARLLRATAESQLGESQAAEDDFALALGRAEEPAARWVALTNRGAMWDQCRRWDDAIRDFREAIALQPDNPEAYIGLAYAYRGRKEWAAAVAALDKALVLRPGDAGFYHSRAELDLDRGDATAARHDFRQAIDHTAPGSAPKRLATDHVELAQLHHEAGKYQDALAACDAALRLLPDYAPAFRQRADTLVALRQYPDAGKALDRFLARGTPTAKDYRARGLIHAELRAYTQAVDAYSRSLALREDADTRAYRGWAYLKLGAPRPALDDFDAALRLEATQTDALCGRGYARARLGRLTEAVTDTEEALRHGKPAALLLFDAACVYAVAVGKLEARSGSRLGPGGAARRYQERAVDLLRAALDAAPAGKREEFWRANVVGAADLVPIRSCTSFLELARSYPR